MFFTQFASFTSCLQEDSSTQNSSRIQHDVFGFPFTNNSIDDSESGSSQYDEDLDENRMVISSLSDFAKHSELYSNMVLCCILI